MLNVIARRAMALPAFASGGPFAGREGTIVAGEGLPESGLSGSERASIATLYVALMTELLIEALGAGGDVLVDGPLATNPFFGSVLSECLSRPVHLSAGESGNTRAACFLAGFADSPAAPMKAAEPIALKELSSYREHWRRAVTR
jgi:hypothetical protein